METVKLKDLQNAAKELNAILFIPGDEQEINVKGTAAELTADITDVIPMLTPEDELTPATQKVINALTIEEHNDEAETDEAETDDVDAPEVPKTPAPAPAPKKGKKPEAIPTAQELIQAAKSREELVTLLNTYTDLKPLRTAHRNYKSNNDLKVVAIALLNGELKPEDIMRAAKDAEKRNAAADKDTPAAKKGAEKKPVAKREKQSGTSFSSFVLGRCAQGGKWEDLVAEIRAEGDSRGAVIKYGKGALLYAIKHHQAKNPEYLKNAKITDDGIVVKK